MVASATKTSNGGRYAGCLDRPTFASPEHWLRHYHRCIQADQRPWHPATASELRLADEHGLLAEYPWWIPGRQGLQILGLPAHFGRRQRPLSDLFQERFLETLVTDPEFQAAVVNCLGATS